MTNAEIAALVAKALDLEPTSVGWCWQGDDNIDEREYLFADGDNIEDPYWFQHCTLWLLENQHMLIFDWRDSHDVWKGSKRIGVQCPAAEFPARAVAQIMKERE